MDKKIFCIMGASATGKTTLVNHMKKWGIEELRSTTTRAMRPGEINGESYYFVTKEEFDGMDKVEETFYSGNYYCLSKAEVDSKLMNNDFVSVVLDKEGVEQLKEKYRDMVVVIYLYSTIEEIIRRMNIRGDTFGSIISRIENYFKNKEGQNNDIADHIIRSKDLKLVIKQMKTIVRYEGYSWWNFLCGYFKYMWKKVFKLGGIK